MMKKYVGITIGPIFKTISAAHSPAGLWLASTFFSEVTKAICNDLLQRFSDDVVIFSPSFTQVDNSSDGIGKYHDRILFVSSAVNKDNISDLIGNVKKNSYKLLGDVFQDKTFLESYLKIDFVIFDEKQLLGKSVLAVLNNALDSLELMPSLSSQKLENAFVSFFTGKSESRNTFIKQSRLFSNQEHLLSSKGNLKTIEDICHDNATNLPYFALVYSDGDKVGKLLKDLCEHYSDSLSDQVSEVQAFSKACLDFSGEASQLVHDYQGMTIYAGGDDLLFLAPVTQILELTQKLDEMFKDKMSTLPSKKAKEVSLSFGIVIHYQKYPLYEALSESYEKLIQAKQQGGNRVCLSLSKHSGQTIELLLENNELAEVATLFKELKGKSDSLQSVIYRLNEQDALFTRLTLLASRLHLSLESFQKRFMNIFDNSNQEIFEDYLKTVAAFYYNHFVVKVVRSDVAVEKDARDKVLSLHKLLRLNQFLSEKEG